jgi:hypothetical protein
MKRILFLLLIAATLPVLIGGCGSEADAEILCEGCNTKLAADMVVKAEGKNFCEGCAPESASDAEVAMLICDGGCGMKMAKADMKAVDGKHYCGGCAAHVGQDDN